MRLGTAFDSDMDDIAFFGRQFFETATKLRLYH